MVNGLERKGPLCVAHGCGTESSGCTWLKQRGVLCRALRFCLFDWRCGSFAAAVVAGGITALPSLRPQELKRDFTMFNNMATCTSVLSFFVLVGECQGEGSCRGARGCGIEGWVAGARRLRTAPHRTAPQAHHRRTAPHRTAHCSEVCLHQPPIPLVRPKHGWTVHTPPAHLRTHQPRCPCCHAPFSYIQSIAMPPSATPTAAAPFPPTCKYIRRP